ncbi:F-box/FBD/LRR-repeat protein At1g78750-like [Cornus florida]|uniref:F-box/FBD/LRR-repeat protein At1g78750-like n=1 Tax=Cornus florida TaxID=4283 RepID=UPI00289D1270|nr:F-box/FBD/LRR-repeat protein At1g78750-like [Cornus florida]
MALISNHEGSSKKVRKFLNKEDRISSLPDSLLVHILSFLPTKYAVGTNNSPSNFMNFVDRVLLHHDLSFIQKFRLNFQNYNVDDFSKIHTWTSIAIKRGVQELDIQISNCPSVQRSFPLSLFTCPTLVVLKLGSFIGFSVPCSTHFKSLKVLHLSVWFFGDEVMENLFCNYPVLEELFIEAALDLRGFWGGDDEDDEREIVVTAPNLEDLTLQDDFLSFYELNDLISLVKADVNIGECCTKSMVIKERANSVFEVLEEISTVKYLSLGARTMGVLDHADDDDNLPLFPNLIRLELHVNKCYGWNHLLDLLNSMPNLQCLVLEKSKECGRPEDDAYENFNFVEQQVVHLCLVMHLQDVKINGFRGLSGELRLIEYFLRNSKVLHKMEIENFNSEEKQEREFLDKLQMLPRGLITCQILITRKENFAPASTQK